MSYQPPTDDNQSAYQTPPQQPYTQYPQTPYPPPPYAPPPSPHSHPPRWFLYWGAIAVSVLGMILNLALFVAGGDGFSARNGEPLCTGVVPYLIVLLGFELLILSILSAILAYLQAEKTRTGATICLVISA